MLKIKRKSGDADSLIPKKKKVQSTKDEKEPKSNYGVEKKGSQNFNGQPLKTKKDVPAQKFDKTGDSVNGQRKTQISKDKKFSKARPNYSKYDKGKPTLREGKGKPFPKDGKPFTKDGKPFTKDGKPFTKDGKPFTKDGKPITKDGEKPKWAEMKKEKKQLRLVRRKAKTTADVFEISHKAKLLAAQIQRKVVKPEFRVNLCKELHGILKGQYKSIALTHDLSRVIQVLLKHSPAEINTEITEELIDLMVPMVQSKYGQHAVKRILKYGTDYIRHEVLKKFFGHIVSLAAHTISASVLDYAYGEFASKKEKTYMQQEFYGDIYKNAKDDKVKTLSDAYKDSPEMKAAILQACKANIQRVLDKNLHDGELLHSVVWSYIGECSNEERSELVSTLSPLLVPLSNSLPGVNAACVCVWQGTNKDKKTILKVVKEHAVALSKHKTGYRLLLAIFDSVDDTVLVKKAIVATLAANLQDVANDHWGNMTLHWLVKPKDPSRFHPSLIRFLAEGATSGTGKKDADIRVSELREAILPQLLQHIEDNPQFWLSSKTAMLLVVAVMSVQSSKAVLDSIAKAVCAPDWSITVNDRPMLAVEDAGIHMCLKKAATLDRDTDGPTFGEAICKHLYDDTLKAWLSTNRGCFFILKLIESNKDSIASTIVKKIKPHTSVLKQQTSEGAKLLLQNVQK